MGNWIVRWYFLPENYNYIVFTLITEYRYIASLTAAVLVELQSRWEKKQTIATTERPRAIAVTAGINQTKEDA